MSINRVLLGPFVAKHHIKCRKGQYIGDKIDGTPCQRGDVPDDKVSFQDEFKDYKPVEFTSKTVLRPDGTFPVWADPSETNGIKFNIIDGKVDRRSHEGEYKFDKTNGRPLNIRGRTGITGRGLLGKWGPNHAADPIVTRWKKPTKISNDEKRILQFVAIQRTDTKEWAIPGGMCDPGESISLTLKREFMEEAANSTEKSARSKEIIDKKLDGIFKNGNLIYKGYVDDPRNTDNAWMETQCYNFHDEHGDLLKDFQLEAGDDARKVKWMDIDSNLSLYASHKDFIKKVVDKHDAFW